jgi:non-ribosomal peptide synthetase component F
LRAVPNGTVGELYIGGDGVARGYLNRPDLTSERFISNLGGHMPSDRLYRTGDRVRLGEDGLLDFVGRVDLQVKVRGFRVELEEIESVLAMHPAVREAAVVATGEEQLIAFVVTVPDLPTNSVGLRKYLAERLPGFMVPSLLVILNRLPLLPNGKLDRSALCALAGKCRAERTSYVAPTTSVEEKLTRIWAEVLRLERVGIHDDFFELGGHSLAAMQAISRVRTELSATVDIRTLFDNPTVCRMAAALHANANELGPTYLGPGQTHVSRDGLLPASHREESLWLMGQQYARFSNEFDAFNVNAALRLKGNLSLVSLERALNEVIRRHEILRTAFVVTDGRLKRSISQVLEFHLSAVKLTDCEDGRDGRARALALKEFHRPFDLSRAPLLRAGVFEFDQTEHLLTLSMHHIISDGWSMEILLQELATLYESSETNKAGSLPTLPIQYTDYATWHRDWLQGSVLEELRHYWTRQLGGMPRYLQIATDRPRPPELNIRGACINFGLSKDMTDALRALSQREGVTLFMILLATFMLLLHRLTGEMDIVTRVPLAERRFPEVEPLIGSFAQLFIFRISFAGNPTFREIIRRLRDTALGAYSHPGLPPRILTEAIKLEPDPSHDALFQTMFNLLDEPITQRIRFVKLEVEPLLVIEEPVLLADFDLHALEKKGCLFFALVYRSDLFSQARMKELSEQFKSLLAQAPQAQGTTIDQFSIVTSSSAAVLPDPARPLGLTYERLLISKLASHTQVAPDRVAVVHPDSTLTYGQLTRRTNQVVRDLITDGIRPGEVVAVYGHCNAELLCLLLAVWKVGAALVILDPLQRVSFLVEGLEVTRPQAWVQLGANPLPASLELCLKELGLRHLQSTGRGINSRRPPFSDDSTDDPGVTIEPDDRAVITLSMGADGRTQKNCVTHGRLAHLCRWMTHTFERGKEDRFCVLSRPGTPRFLEEAFTSLWAGGELHIPDEAELAQDRITKWMAEQGITVVHLDPVMCRDFEPSPQTLLSSLRLAFISGETLTKQDVIRLKELAPSARCVNVYRPQGIGQAVAYIAVDQPQSLTKNVVPLGVGIDGIQLLIVTKGNGLAGVGELGEICIRGPEMMHCREARSFDPERILLKPFSREENDWLVRTGDLGRYLPDGSVELIGSDFNHGHVNGYRIETIEIEAMLLEHEAVHHAAVVIYENGTSESQLVACIVSRQKKKVSLHEVRTFLQSRLPAFSLPSQLVHLDALPRNGNGRIDRTYLADLVKNELTKN